MKPRERTFAMPLITVAALSVWSFSSSHLLQIEHGESVCSSLSKGAIVYVCGSSAMREDVEKALCSILSRYGVKSVLRSVYLTAHVISFACLSS